MSLAFSYNIRHLLAKRTTTFMTLMGIALVEFVLVATLMLSAGLKKTLSTTGSPNNVIVIRTGAQNEIQSGLKREQANVILAEPEVARTDDNQPLSSTDCVVLISLKKRSDNLPSNVTLRGTSKYGLQVRPSIKMVQGRLPSQGTNEVMVGKAINAKFAGADIGGKVRLVGTDWPIVGIFDAGNSGFNSEIWGDSDILMPSFKRDQFSSVTFQLKPGSNFDAMKNRLENDQRLTVTVKRESDFYADQSKSLSMFITIIGSFISVIFSIGAIVGAMITMYSSVANRTREIGILRALGFKPRSIFVAFVKECLLIGFVGGVLGIILASFMMAVGISTTNFTTFSEVAFGFTLQPWIVVVGLIFSVTMGFVGGALPALRASRIKILSALRD
jgi:putative ABC transport system permease protein